MSEQRTLHQRLTHLRLESDNDALLALFPPAFTRLELRVDVLEVEGVISLLSRTLDIQARQIIVTGGEPAVLDVSGFPVGPVDGEAAANGSPSSPDGQPGQAGRNGKDAGDITIVAHEIIGDLEIRANGSDGGHGQPGGNGVKPARPDGADGAWKNPKNKSEGGVHGGGKVGAFGEWYQALAKGQPGGRARAGGNAGTAGRGGDGGNGGSVSVHVVGQPPVVVEARAGAAGASGANADAGPAGDPGHGGQNLFCYKAPLGSEVVNWVGTKSGEFPYYKKKHGFANRMPNGKGGAAGGTVPPPPESASGGVSHEPSVSVVEPGRQAALIETSLLELSLSRAHRGATDDPDLALQRCNWVLSLTADNQDTDLHALHVQALSEVRCAWPQATS